MLIRIKTHRLVREARYLLEEPGCDECAEAGELIASALELSPHHEGAQAMMEEADACLAHCKLKRVTIAVVGVVIFFVFAGSIGAYFLLSRPGNFLSSLSSKAKSSRPAAWALEGIEGPCIGHIYPLQKEETIIGSQSPPADIEICDELRKISRRHCAIMRNGKRFYVVDESTNGTKLNDREIERGVATELRRGDRIALADVAVLWLKQM
ncbi:MAG: FHA domain-containing protein [Pyrinomonadaceae bacterium]